MRSLLYSLLSLATLATVLAGDAAPAKTAEDWDEVVPDTVFNGQTVPPMKELDSIHIEEDLSKGNWLVEFFSPKCPHCVAFIPTWQTLYEFYYTSKPIQSKDQSERDSLNTFTRYYDFKFAKVDCVAFRDACEAHNVRGYPSIIQFKDGKEIKRVKGAQGLADLSQWVEEILESVRPGSRVKGGPKLPKVGANSVETGPETEEEVKEKEGAKEETPVTSAPASEASEVTESTPPNVKEPEKAKANMNPSGISEPLTAETFQKRVTDALEPWFIKFYAPWCHHCQAMQPNWAAMAREMRGKLNIGEVNCDAEKRLCRDAGVRGYPTLLFFRGGERAEYNGLRGVGDLIAHAEKVVDIGSGVPDVDLAAFEKLEETEEVIFVFFYDHATTTEDFMALDRLTLSLIDKAKLVKSKDPAMFKRFKISTWPRIMVSRDGKPSYYAPLAPKDTRDVKKVLTWMKSVWLPIVPELTATNARDIMDGKYVVLAVLNRERKEEFANAKRELKNAALEWIDKQTQMFQLERQELRDAKQLRIEEAEDKGDERAVMNAKNIRIDMDELDRKSVGFAWVDGVFWERWVKSTYGVDVKVDGERAIINDEDNKRFWDTTINGEPIRVSRTYILETIPKVISSPPKISAKSTTGTFSRWFFNMRHFCSAHPWLALAMVVAALLVGSVVGKNKMRRRGYGSPSGFLQTGEKDGLLGGFGGQGKKD
ncbi:thioredoxin-domain-containing protein [Westerdykella ornata]|uniref:Thioredoxin-domain-containing protein n=1 Tax=Westerdykella ornata TaxID=318751 RepID=A0A6A6JL25_WESOR|nr:thioredoxin-domain-containing protein [Westerdykella ornata]KAF2275599.1 thioredoxin-domain-containing protein [Westerdykella ornata]